MCVNDVLCGGAKPLFFLDYFATGQLEPETAEAVVKGIADGCEQAGCALIGGETAELPGFYAPGEYDLAGFCVGIVDKPKIIDGSQIAPGDVILGLPSSGLHSNGFSLARKVLEPLGYETIDSSLNCSLGTAMLEPTRIYVKPVLSLLEKIPVKGMVHITGGGFYENIPRVLPQNTRAVIQKGIWPILPLFQMLQESGIAEREMFTTFNMGIGFVLIVAAQDAEAAKAHLQMQGETVYQLGMVEAGEAGVILNE
jgi:phosphoribosylformylglycinamidine cyclo-ligase